MKMVNWKCYLCGDEYSETHIEFHLVGVHGVAGPKEMYSSSTSSLEIAKITNVGGMHKKPLVTTSVNDPPTSSSKLNGGSGDSRQTGNNGDDRRSITSKNLLTSGDLWLLCKLLFPRFFTLPSSFVATYTL